MGFFLLWSCGPLGLARSGRSWCGQYPAFRFLISLFPSSSPLHPAATSREKRGPFRCGFPGCKKKFTTHQGRRSHETHGHRGEAQHIRRSRGSVEAEGSRFEGEEEEDEDEDEDGEGEGDESDEADPRHTKTPRGGVDEASEASARSSGAEDGAEASEVEDLDESGSGRNPLTCTIWSSSHGHRC